MLEPQIKLCSIFRIVICSDTRIGNLRKQIADRANLMKEILSHNPQIQQVADGGVHIASNSEQAHSFFENYWNKEVHTRIVGQLIFLSSSMEEEAVRIRRMLEYSVRVVVLSSSVRPPDSVRVLYRGEYDATFQDFVRLMGIQPEIE